jgi:hypothetical protein
MFHNIQGRQDIEKFSCVSGTLFLVTNRLPRTTGLMPSLGVGSNLKPHESKYNRRLNSPNFRNDRDILRREAHKWSQKFLNSTTARSEIFARSQRP